MMMSYRVVIGARTANKLSPPCLKGNALSILKTLPGFSLVTMGKRWENQCYLGGGVFCSLSWEKRNKKHAEVTSIIDWNLCVICARRSKRRRSPSPTHVYAPIYWLIIHSSAINIAFWCGAFCLK